MKRFLIIFILFYLNHILHCYPLTKENEFFKIETKNKEYIFFDISQNINGKNFLNIQVIICDINNYNSQLSIVNENIIIYSTDLVSSRQFSIDITQYKYKQLKIKATSPKMFIQYQFIKNPITLFPLGLIKNIFSKSEKRTINFYLSPIVNNTQSTYELYFSKNNIMKRCEKLEYSLNNKPIATQKIKGINYFNLNFQYLIYDSEEKNINGYVFIKGIDVDDFNYVYFYDTNEVTLHLDKKKDIDNKKNGNSFSTFLFIIFCFLCILLILYFLKKNKFFERKNDFVKIDSSL